MTRWYRAYVGTVSDDKLAEVAMVAASSRCVAVSVWHAILESAAADENNGAFSTTPRRVAATLQERCETVECVFAAMRELQMIDGNAIAAWQRRQFESDSSTERSRRHRENRGKPHATLPQRDATPPETETDPEKEEEALLPQCSLPEETGNPDVIDLKAKKNEIAKRELRGELQAFGEQWNVMAARLNLKLVDFIKAGSSREKQSLARLAELRDDYHANAEVLLSKIATSTFLSGRKNDFRASFDWIIKSANFTKIMEGNYEDQKGSQASPRSSFGSPYLRG